MKKKIDLKAAYAISDNVVSREVHGEFVIVPITSEAGNSGEEIYSLNETGKAIWDKLDGKKKLQKIIGDLAKEFKADITAVENDTIGLLEELLKRKMIIKAKKA